MTDEQRFIGLFAVNGANRIGRIEQEKRDQVGHYWIGQGVDGNSWMSRMPALLQQKDQNFLSQKVAG